MISVIVAYNDRDVLDDMLARSLAGQSAAHEVIALDNRQHRYSSAAAAANEGANRARGDFLFFAHQDVAFDDQGWLARAERLLAALPDLGIAGVAGAVAGDGQAGRVIVSNIHDSTPPQREGHRSLSRPEPVETVDECAFFVPRAIFEQMPFDERTCSGWHLHAVDYSLSVRRRGLQVYALPLALYHRSRGATVRVFGIDTYDAAYFRALRRVLAKHRDAYAEVATTCGIWSTRKGVLLQRFPPAALRGALRAWLLDRRQRRPS
jgi:GT2 family glycosyltransferase